MRIRTLFAICVLGWATLPVMADTVTVHIFSNNFSTNVSGQPIVEPHINVGDTIHWKWDSGFHNTIAAAKQTDTWTSGAATSGPHSFDHTFNKPGTFWYYCSVHGSDKGDGTGSGMAKRIFVETIVSGTVTLQECLKPAQSVDFEFRPTDNTAKFTRTVILNADGSFALKNLPAKAYKLAIKGQKWLRKVMDVDTSVGNVTTVAVTLTAGDTNNDNKVDLDDLGNLANAFDTKPGDTLYDANSDLNCDDLVNLDDLGLLALNFDTAGDP